jgi:hypothetical protein
MTPTTTTIAARSTTAAAANTITTTYSSLQGLDYFKPIRLGNFLSGS